MATQQICEAALDEHEEKLSTLPNVIGLGIVALDETDPESSELAVAVYVRKKISDDELEAFEVIPKIIRITQGDLLQEVPTRVIEQGDVSLEGNETNSGFSTELL